MKTNYLKSLIPDAKWQKTTMLLLLYLMMLLPGANAQTQIPIAGITGVSPSWYSDVCAANTVAGVTDGNYSTGNETNYGNSYIIYDLGSVKSISNMEIAPQGGCGWGPPYLNAANVYGSSDNSTYTLIGSIPNVTIGVMTTTGLSFTARYVKIELGNNYLGIGELRFYGGASNPAPTISSFTPTSAATGTTVTITGTNFTGATAVSFGGTAASSFSVVSATSITAVVGNGTTGSVSVTTPGGTATSAGTFTFQPVHFLASGAGTANANGIYIEAGLNDGVSYYVKSGSPTMYLYRAYDFYNGSMWFNGTVLGSTSAYSYYDMSSNATPAGISFDYFNWPDGTSPNPVISSPNPITNISPASAVAGTTITLTGYYFTGATAVSIGGVPVASFTVVNSNSITAVVANGNTGQVSVTTPSATMLSVGTFSEILTPAISSFTPTSAASGATVTITGTNFTGATAVSFGGTAASSYTVVSATSITAVVGNGATGNVSVTTAGGTATLAGFTYIANITWTGTTSTAWNTGSNWSTGSVPTASDNVTIPDVTYDPHIVSGVGANCNNMTVNSGANLIVNSGGSLITNGSITNNGTISIKRDMSASTWHLVSSPVTSANASIFLGDYLQSWIEGSHTWTDITNPDASLQPLHGYGLWATPSKAPSASYTFTGTPNTGNQSQAISFTEYSSSPLAYEGANLLGNPYPSAIDWEGLRTTYGAVYYWNGSIYVSWNGSGTGSRYIPTMQGFFIVTASNSTFSLTNANRTHTMSGYYKSAEETKENLLVLETESIGISDKLYVNFSDEATEDFDLQHDAYKFASGTAGLSELYSYSSDKKLSIDVRPSCEVVQLGFSNSEGGTYSIGISQLNGISKATLEDTKTNTFNDLLKGAYSFSWLAGEDDKRFKLHMGTVSVEETPDSEIRIYSYHKTAYINLKNQLKGDIYIYNMAGQLITSRETAIGLVSVGINAPGIYIVKVVSDKKTTTDKIFIQ